MGEPVYILLMLASILVSYVGGMLISRFKQQGKAKAAKWTLFCSCAASLSLLGFFKYADFIITNANSLFGTGVGWFHVALPIGISFYTFQTVSYMADVYRGEADCQRNPVSFGTYVTMFPQLIAGPIVQYKTIDAQLRGRSETMEQFAEGARRFMIGLGKKVLLANSAGALWDTIQGMGSADVPVLTAWMGLAAYTFQIYFDFSGYSDMAIGLGCLFGFRFRENFNYPYLSKSITEFWRRWHISLGTWFREYVYIPLGGNRAGTLRHLRNILIVWMLTGIWHGASWNFVLWGLYYGGLLLAEKYLFGNWLERLPAGFRHVYCLFLVMLGWNLFAFDSLPQGIGFFKALFGVYGQGIANRETIYLLYNHVVLLTFCIIGCTKLPSSVGARLCAARNASILQNIFYAGLFILSIAWIVDATYNPFLYFRF